MLTFQVEFARRVIAAESEGQVGRKVENKNKASWKGNSPSNAPRGRIRGGGAEEPERAPGPSKNEQDCTADEVRHKNRKKW